MKRITVSLACLMMLCLSSSLRAEESEGEKAFQSYAKHMVGGIWKSTQPTQEQNQFVNEFRWLAGNRFIRNVGSINGEPFGGITITGVDPETDKVTTWWFLRRRTSKTTMASEKQGVWIGTGEFVNADGDKVKQTIKTTFVDEDEIRMEMVERSVNGEKQDVESTPPWIMHRHDEEYKGELLAAVPADVELEAKSEAEKVVKSIGEFMVGGVWKGIGVNGQEGNQRYRWFAGKKFVLLTPKQPTTAIGVLGVDPETDLATWWWFRENGLATTTVKQEKDGVWIFQSDFLNKDKQRTISKHRLSKLDADKVRIEPLTLSVDGTAMETGKAQTWTRHKE